MPSDTVPMWKVLITSDLSWALGYLQMFNQDDKLTPALERIEKSLKDLRGKEANE
jgi:hypothetical protein